MLPWNPTTSVVGGCQLIDKWVEGKDNKHICFQGDIDWCVKFKNYFSQYKPPYYYILQKSTGKEYALLHLESAQLKNIRDLGLTDEEYLPVKDLVEDILIKYDDALENIDINTTDLSVVMKYIGSESLKKLIGNNLSPILTQAIDSFDYNLINKIFDTYSVKNIKDSINETDLTWMFKNNIHYFHALTEHTIKILLNDFGLDIDNLVSNMMQYNSNGYVVAGRNKVIEMLINNDYISPNHSIILKGGDNYEQTLFIKAISNQNIELFDYLQIGRAHV